MASIKLNNYEIFSQTGTDAPKLNSSTGLNFDTTNHSFTVKGVDAPIVGANYSTNDDANSGQLAIYNGATKLWSINENGWVQQHKGIALSLLALGSNAYITTTVNTPLPYNTIESYSGDSNLYYNTSTYRFTAPVSGFYCMGATWLSDNVGDDFELHWYKNGAIIRRNYNGQDNRTIDASTIMQLDAGDYFEFIAGTAESFYLGNGATNAYSHAFIYLIG